MSEIRNNIRGIIIKDNKLLTIKIVDGDAEYFILPGGKLEFGETATEAVIRECEEELGCKVSVGRCVFIREFIGPRRKNPVGNVANKQFLELYFEAKLITNPDMQLRENHQKEIAWLDINKLEQFDIKPEFLKTSIRNRSECSDIYIGDVE